MANCLMCGKTCGFFDFCKKCNELKNEGKIIQCEKCKEWHYTDKSCKCIKEETSSLNNEIQSLNIEEPIKKCILCSEKTEGFLFCKKCYFKYKNKVLLIEISKCKDIKILDISYEGKYTCTDGHIVKSKSEMAIDDYLYTNNIRHAYEHALSIDDNSAHDLHPDFYLPDYYGEKIYIEHWGYDETNKEYTETKEYKIEHYKKAKITLICTEEQRDMININAALNRKLEHYKKNEINL